MINGPLRSTNPRRVDRKNRPTPSADFVISPYLSNLVGGLQTNSRVYGWGIRHESLHHDETARVAVQLRVVPPGLVEAIVDSVKSVDLGWRGKIVGDCFPFLWNLLAEFLLPLDGCFETVAPV